MCVPLGVLSLVHIGPEVEHEPQLLSENVDDVTVLTFSQLSVPKALSPCVILSHTPLHITPVGGHDPRPHAYAGSNMRTPAPAHTVWFPNLDEEPPPSVHTARSRTRTRTHTDDSEWEVCELSELGSDGLVEDASDTHPHTHIHVTQPQVSNTNTSDAVCVSASEALLLCVNAQQSMRRSDMVIPHTDRHLCMSVYEVEARLVSVMHYVFSSLVDRTVAQLSRFVPGGRQHTAVNVDESSPLPRMHSDTLVLLRALITHMASAASVQTSLGTGLEESLARLLTQLDDDVSLAEKSTSSSTALGVRVREGWLRLELLMDVMHECARALFYGVIARVARRVESHVCDRMCQETPNGVELYLQHLHHVRRPATSRNVKSLIQECIEMRKYRIATWLLPMVSMFTIDPRHVCLRVYLVCMSLY